MPKDGRAAAILALGVAAVGGALLLTRKAAPKKGKHPGDDITFYVQLKSTFTYELFNISVMIKVPGLMNVPMPIINLDGMKTKIFNVTSVIPDSAEPGAYDVIVTAENPEIATVTRTFAKMLNIV